MKVRKKYLTIKVIVTIRNVPPVLRFSELVVLLPEGRLYNVQLEVFLQYRKVSPEVFGKNDDLVESTD